MLDLSDEEDGFNTSRVERRPRGYELDGKHYFTVSNDFTLVWNDLFQNKLKNGIVGCPKPASVKNQSFYEPNGDIISNTLDKFLGKKKDKGNDKSASKKKKEAEYLFVPSSMRELGPRLIDTYPDIGIEDFKIMRFLGRGAFGTVDLVK